MYQKLQKLLSGTESGQSNYQELLKRLLGMVKEVACIEGKNKTAIPFLSVYLRNSPTPLFPSVLTPSFCLILQGMKKLHLGQDIIYYHAGDYLASVIDIPASAQVVKASKDFPYIGLCIEFTTQEISSVILDAEINVKPKDKKASTAAFVGKSDGTVLDLCIRLLKLIDRPDAAPFLSALIKREMIFHLLTGDHGYLFFQQALFDSQVNGIGKAITWIKEHLSQSFTVEELAKICNMSVSGLHHKFKAITTTGPLQYQKNLRLQEARRLLLSGSMDAGTVASQVGYESSSQFIREYRRLFGLPPIKDIKEIRSNSMADTLVNG
jgi:AraC-like DNA-binding protein